MLGWNFFILTMLPLSGGIGAYASLIWWYRRPTLALILGELQRRPVKRPPPYVGGALGGASAPTAPPTAPPT